MSGRESSDGESSAATASETSKKQQDDSEKDRCFCNNSKFDGFMIQCDECLKWSHGLCVKMTVPLSKTIKLFRCDRCVRDNPQLQRITYKNKFVNDAERLEAENEAAFVRCEKCIGCFRKDKCFKCEACTRDPPAECIKLRCISWVEQMGPKKTPGRPREPVASSRSTEESDGSPERTKPDTPRARASPEKKRGRKKGWRKDQANVSISEPKKEVETLNKPSRPQERLHAEHDREVASAVYGSFTNRKKAPRGNANQNDIPRQCNEPDCIKEARMNSKYCSDECGMKLAKTRLLTILPGRVTEFWRLKPDALTRNELLMEELEKDTENIKKTIVRMREFYEMILRFVSALKDVDPSPSNGDEETDYDMTANCTVCASEVSTKQLMKHIERCFVRSEKQLTFGTATQAVYNPDQLFCDTYNKISGTYCKRLRVVCAEHYKGELENTLKICGCPKIWSNNSSLNFEEIFVGGQNWIDGGFCTNARKDCNSHHRWLQTLLGVVEGERMNLLTRLDDLNERRNNISLNKTYKGDVISLLSSHSKQVADKTG